MTQRRAAKRTACPRQLSTARYAMTELGVRQRLAFEVPRAIHGDSKAAAFREAVVAGIRDLSNAIRSVRDDAG